MDNCSSCTYLKLNAPDLYGRYWCEKRLERHGANEAAYNRYCKAYSRSTGEADSAYNYSKEHGNTSFGCYLTTMICEILGMDDNNEYLNAMRELRNNFLQPQLKYKSILVEYDIVGPKIAEALRNDPLKEKIAQAYFNNYILPTTFFVKMKAYNQALDKYMEMTSYLKNFYMINTPVTQLEIDEVDTKYMGHGQYVKKATI